MARIDKILNMEQVWCCIPIISATQKLRQKHHKFKAGQCNPSEILPENKRIKDWEGSSAVFGINSQYWKKVFKVL